MANIASIKSVLVGLSEYIQCGTLAPDEEMSLEFNDALVVEDIALEGTTGRSLSLLIVFPSLGLTSTVADGLDGGNWFLNSGSNDAGKRWYRLPARSKIIVKNNSTSNSIVKITLVGSSV